MKLYRAKLIYSFGHPYPKAKLQLAAEIGIRTCSVQCGGGVNGGLVLPNRLVAIPIIHPNRTARISFQNNTGTVGKVVWADGEITLLHCPMTPTVTESGLDHTCVGDFLYSFHDKRLHVWQKESHIGRPHRQDLLGRSIPLFTEDKHFAGFVIWNPHNRIHPVVTEQNLNPEGS